MHTGGRTFKSEPGSKSELSHGQAGPVLICEQRCALTECISAGGNSIEKMNGGDNYVRERKTGIVLVTH